MDELYHNTVKAMNTSINELRNRIKPFDTCDDRAKLAELNTIENRLNEMSIAGMAVWVLLILIMELFGSSNSIIALSNIIPANVLPYVMQGSILGFSLLNTITIDKKEKRRKEYKKFCKARNDKEKIIERMKYLIESEELKYKNTILYNAEKSIDRNEETFKDIITEYDPSSKFIPQSREDIQENISDLKKELNDKYNELHILVTKHILNRNFHFRSKYLFERIFRVIQSGMIGQIVSLVFVSFPYAYLQHFLGYSFFSETKLFGSVLIGLIGGSLYRIIRDGNYVKAFNHINSKLGKEALSNRINDKNKEEKEINDKINKLIPEISNIEVKLQIQSRIYELLDNSDEYNEKNKVIATSIKEQTIEENLDNIIEEKGFSKILRI